MSIDRLSELQDLIDKFNAAKPADQKAAMEAVSYTHLDVYKRQSLTGLFVCSCTSSSNWSTLTDGLAGLKSNKIGRAHV